MSFQTPITIYEAMENIKSQRYLLPAIQREFEWPPYKIEWLFDSLMRGYPISSFLLWNVEDISSAGYKFYHFLRVYRERYKIHNDEASMEGKSNFHAVLDGQQRLTSLYVGLMGSYAYKEYRRNFADTEYSIPTRHLYLNIAEKLKDQEDGRVYDFEFLKESDTQKADLYDNKWFRVGKILDLKNLSVFNKYITEKGLEDDSIEILARLQETIFTDRIINYFLEKEQDLDKALNIFIRINSGGKPLDFSDLIMSIAIANWQTKDAKGEIHKLVDLVQEFGFTISKDFIFKTYLYLHSSDIKFKVTNFSKENAHNFEEEWESIRDAILSAFRLVKTFGYTDFTLTSKNAVIPIIYYIYHREIHPCIETRSHFKEDRNIIKKWLHVVTLKRVFGGQSDGTLSQIRKGFTDDVSSDVKVKEGITVFPVNEINQAIRRDISVGDEFIDELLKTQKDDRYAFSILALLYPHLDYKNNDFHKDHLHPISHFGYKAITNMNLNDDERYKFLSSERNNSIINLQLLDANENMSKQGKTLQEWIKHEGQSKSKDLLLDRCLIPRDAGLEFKDFIDFTDKRKELLRDRLKALLT